MYHAGQAHPEVQQIKVNAAGDTAHVTWSDFGGSVTRVTLAVTALAPTTVVQAHFQLKRVLPRIIAQQGRSGGASMNKRERVEAALRGEPVDRVPISMWGHNYLKEWTPEGLAEAMLENYRAYDWDYMKVNPRASYHVEDWGATLTRPTDPNQSPKFLDLADQRGGGLAASASARTR